MSLPRHLKGINLKVSLVINVALENVPTGPIFFVVRAEKGDEKGPWSNVAHFGHYQSSSDQEIKLENGAKILTTGNISGEEVDIFFSDKSTSVDLIYGE